jgi:hypothetical protein
MAKRYLMGNQRPYIKKDRQCKLSILFWYTASDFPLGIFWPLYCLSFFDIRPLISHWVSFGHCIVYPFLIYGIRGRISKKDRQYNGQKIPNGKSEAVYKKRIDNTMAKRYLMENQRFWVWTFPLYAFSESRNFLFAFFGPCLVYPFLIYGLWFPIRYLLAIALSILFLYTPLISH